MTLRLQPAAAATMSFVKRLLRRCVSNKFQTLMTCLWMHTHRRLFCEGRSRRGKWDRMRGPVPPAPSRCITRYKIETFCGAFHCLCGKAACHQHVDNAPGGGLFRTPLNISKKKPLAETARGEAGREEGVRCADRWSAGAGGAVRCL